MSYDAGKEKAEYILLMLRLEEAETLEDKLKIFDQWKQERNLKIYGENIQDK